MRLRNVDIEGRKTSHAAGVVDEGVEEDLWDVAGTAGEKRSSTRGLGLRGPFRHGGPQGEEVLRSHFPMPRRQMSGATLGRAMVSARREDA